MEIRLVPHLKSSGQQLHHPNRRLRPPLLRAPLAVVGVLLRELAKRAVVDLPRCGRDYAEMSAKMSAEMRPRCGRDKRRYAAEIAPRSDLLLRAALEYRISVHVRQLQQRAHRAGAAHRLEERDECFVNRRLAREPRVRCPSGGPHDFE